MRFSLRSWKDQFIILFENDRTTQAFNWNMLILLQLRLHWGISNLKLIDLFICFQEVRVGSVIVVRFWCIKCGLMLNVRSCTVRGPPHGGRISPNKVSSIKYHFYETAFFGVRRRKLCLCQNCSVLFVKKE